MCFDITARILKTRWATALTRDDLLTLRDALAVTWINIDGMPELTMPATIFISIALFFGVYDMNLKHVPQLEWRWGCGLVWGVLIITAAAMVIVFKKNNWR